MRILIVEDETRSRESLAKGLRESGFMVDAARDGGEAIYYANGSHYDLIVLDVMLPVLDGWEVLRIIREKNTHTPVLFLTARDSVSDRVRGLELGGDDYIVKPFAWVEFVARVRALLRRAPARHSECVVVADLELDLQSMKARRGGRPLELTAKEFQLLSLLVRRKGEVFSRATLAELVWEMNYSIDSNAVDVTIGRLRRKVDDGHGRKLIHTQRGHGYMLEDRG
ncbi:heavy metal response regulator transcription factor [Verrucomicrobium sp. BvORR106]|uniref:heavy metal response regulator transcription factor n=1 Tax=Verrucomicrobium sp. BvORR106 TaxID=1403819 RepID=UPI0005716150|nr:heavy metal response regulator transcription factor [Verrucomicrobium sp. BvORR106]